MNSYVRALLVEDDSTAVELAQEAFEESGIPYSLEVASDGEVALQKLRLSEDKPHIILLDLNLPKKSGLEVLREIKSDPGIKHLPVIILTNSGAQDDVSRAYSYHCNAYVRKPMGFDKLVDHIKAINAFWFEIATLPTSEPPSSQPKRSKCHSILP